MDLQNLPHEIQALEHADAASVRAVLRDVLGGARAPDGCSWTCATVTADAIAYEGFEDAPMHGDEGTWLRREIDGAEVRVLEFGLFDGEDDEFRYELALVFEAGDLDDWYHVVEGFERYVQLDEALDESWSVIDGRELCAMSWCES